MDFDPETTSSGQDISDYTNERNSVFENYKRQTIPVNTTLTCKSAKVWAFYHEHPHLDFEKMNIMFTDILVSIMHTTNPENNTNITSQILNGIANIQSQLTNQQNEYDKQLFLKLTEFKKEYIDDLKMILSSNIADKIAPLIKESNGNIVDKTQLLLSELVPKNNENLSRQINENIKSFCSSITEEISKTSKMDGEPLSQSSLDTFIKTIDSKFANVIDSTKKMVDSNKDATMSHFSSLTSSITSSQNALQSEVKDVLKKMENSSSKGKMSENIVLNILRGLFPSAEVEYVGSQKESGDIMIHRKDKQKILVENKCYESRQVTSDQVKKFIHDVDTQNCSGLFLSQEGGIANKENFEINIHNRNVLLYIHNVNYDPEIIKIAIDIIDSFKSKLDEITLTEDYSISNDTLEEINKEYQLFVEQKLSQLKMVKDFSQKMIKSIEDVQLPSLEKMLSSRFGYTTSGKFICDKCHFVGKNRLALSVHKRTCDKTPTEEVGDVAPINIQLTLPPPEQQPIVQQKQSKTVTKKGH
jgi:hypothetical protein